MAGQGGTGWVLRCDGVYESPEGLEREVITGRGEGQIDIHHSVSQQTLLEHLLSARCCAGCCGYR